MLCCYLSCKFYNVGLVWLCDQLVAIKQLNHEGLQGHQEFIVEVLMLSLLHHDNLVTLIGYCTSGDQRLLVYEYMPMGSLEDHLYGKFIYPLILLIIYFLSLLFPIAWATIRFNCRRCEWKLILHDISLCIGYLWSALDITIKTAIVPDLLLLLRAFP